MLGSGLARAPSTEMATTRTILVAGTASHVGKSTVTAGLCRLIAESGTTVAPFKAQNMSNEARAVLRPPAVGDPPSGEIGVAQTIQARAAGVRATTDMNPVLLKPQGEGHSRLLLDGVATDAVAAGAYYADHWHTAREHALAAFDRLAAEASVIVAEGAGSIAELNLQHRDLANTELARHADAEIILVADIERGGVFAQVVGTLSLMPEDLRRQVVGIIITKFRGDRALFAEGRAMLEAETGVDVLGVLPYTAYGLPEEDSLAYPDTEVALRGDVDAAAALEIAVPRLPRMANTTDLDPLATSAGVVLRFIPRTRGWVTRMRWSCRAQRTRSMTCALWRPAASPRSCADTRGRWWGSVVAISCWASGSSTPVMSHLVGHGSSAGCRSSPSRPTSPQRRRWHRSPGSTRVGPSSGPSLHLPTAM
jgi:adenosylcobyric acid synthase (glutamine-hydrolysing) (EC 6.3.5.10)